MKTIVLKKKVLNKKDFVKRSAKEPDTSTLISEPTILIDEDSKEVVGIYDFLDLDSKGITQILKNLKYTKGARSRGLISTSRIFGYRPRNEMRQDFCSSTSLAKESPREHEIIAGLALKLEEHYKKYNSAGYEKHKLLVDEKVKDSWRISGKSLFTSGIINKNNPLKYHFDTGNFNGVFSMMVVFKGGVEGGYLSLPEYDLKFECADNSVFLFDGQSLLHEVTPIKYRTQSSYRFSIVYYTLKRIWECLEIKDEIQRIREKKTEKERVRMEVPLTERERQLKVDRKILLKSRYGKQ